jgi:hypothetical protein
MATFSKKETIINRLLGKGVITQEEGRVLLDIDEPLYADFPATYEEFSIIVDKVAVDTGMTEEDLDMMVARYPKLDIKPTDYRFLNGSLW